MFKKTLLIIASVLILPMTGLAQVTPSFSAYPLSPNKILPSQFSFEVRPGETSNQDILEISNNADSESTFTIAGVDPVQNKKGDLSFKLSSDQQEGSGNWIVPEEKEIILAPHTKHDVKFQIIAPLDTKLGDYFAGIEAQQITTSQVKTAEGINVNVNLRILNKVNIKVTDNPHPIEKAPASNMFTPTQLYLYGSMGLFVIVIGYFLVQATRKHKAKKHHS